MRSQEVAITVTPRNGLPHVTIQGNVDVWHTRTVEDVFESFILQDTDSLTVDISRASFHDVESLSSLIRTLRIASMDMQMALVAGDSTAAILKHADIGPEIAIKSIAEAEPEDISRPLEYFSSRYVPRKSDQDELPLAA